MKRHRCVLLAVLCACAFLSACKSTPGNPGNNKLDPDKAKQTVVSSMSKICAATDFGTFTTEGKQATVDYKCNAGFQRSNQASFTLGDDGSWYLAAASAIDKFTPPIKVE